MNDLASTCEELSRKRSFPAILGAIVAVLHLPAFVVKILDPDEAYIATVAMVLRNGGQLYVDTVDRKPPGVFWIYAGLQWLTGSTALWIPRCAGMVAHTLTAWLVWRIARHVTTERGAAIAGILSAISSGALIPRDAQAANFEVFMLPFICASILFALQHRPARSGISLGLAIMMKQTAGVTVLPLVWILFKAKGWRGVLILCATAVLPVAGAAWITGPEQFWFWVFGKANSGYIDIGGAWREVLPPMLAVTAFTLLINTGAVWLSRHSWATRREHLDIWLWLLSGVAAVCAGSRFFGHYYWHLLPPLCVLAGIGAAASPSPRTNRALSLSAIAAVIVTAVAFSIPLVQGPEHADVVGKYVGAHTDPDDRVFIWGHLPGVYISANRLPASELVTSAFLTGHTAARPKDSVGEEHAIPGTWDRVMRQLSEHPPELIVDDLGSQSTSSKEFPIATFPKMQRFLKQNYHREATIDGSLIYRSNGSSKHAS